MQGTVVNVGLGKQNLSNIYIKLKGGAVYQCLISNAHKRSEVLAGLEKAKHEGRKPTVKLDRNEWRKVR